MQRPTRLSRFSSEGPTRLASKTRRRRRGAVAVEFAFVAPLFVSILLGASEASRLFDLRNQLSLAAREGARMAAMDREGLVQGGQTTNQKVEQDIRNFLTANGLPGDEADVFIVDFDDHTTPFDLDNAANNGELFELRVELPYTVLGGLGGGLGDDLALSAMVVFRNARATIVQ
jgi:Flp pilus assembly protein TadG